MSAPEPKSKNCFYVFRNKQWEEIFIIEAQNCEFLVFVELGKDNWYLRGSYRDIGSAKGQITKRKLQNIPGKIKTYMINLNEFTFEEVYFGKDYA